MDLQDGQGQCLMSAPVSEYGAGIAWIDRIGLGLMSDHVETAQRFLNDADREYAAGDVLQTSEKLWEDASHVVIAEMKSRGVDVKTRRADVGVD